MQIIRQKDIREFVELKKTICKLPSFTINSQKRKRIFSLFLETNLNLCHYSNECVIAGYYQKNKKRHRKYLILEQL